MSGETEVTAPSPEGKTRQKSVFAGLLIANIAITIGSAIFIAIFSIMLIPMMLEPSNPLLIKLAARLILLIPVVAALGTLCSVLGCCVPDKTLLMGATAPYMYLMFAFVFFLLTFGLYKLVYAVF